MSSTLDYSRNRSPQWSNNPRQRSLLYSENSRQACQKQKVNKPRFLKTISFVFPKSVWDSERVFLEWHGGWWEGQVFGLKYLDFIFQRAEALA